jgi:hypothetical protein
VDKFFARTQSPLRMASRALSANPRTLEARSACVAFKFLPCASSKFLSATSRLRCVSAFAWVNSSESTSGAIVGSTCFPEREDSAGSGAVTRGLGGCRRSTPISGGSETVSAGTSGGDSNSEFAAGSTGRTGAMKLTTGLAGALRVPQPQTHTAHRPKTTAAHRFVFAICVIICLRVQESALLSSQW